MIGQKIGDYRVTELLGEGGMGVVFKAVHETLGQVVAIKMLHPSLLLEDKVKSRFVREAQALARLNHPNIVRLLNFIDREDTCFIVMEYVEGKTIEKLMRELHTIPPLMAADYFVQVLAAMNYAHSLGIIHRDIKPSNIAVVDSGQVKMLDFGTAKMVGTQRLTQEGMTLGTLVYMSPEQICGRELDQRSDIYSLGVTLYEIVTGKLPHWTENEMDLVKQIARGVPPPPSTHLKTIPKRLEAIIMRAIEKDPARRYPTDEEFLTDLRAFISEEKIREKKITPPSGVRRIEPGAIGAETGAAVRGGGRVNGGLLALGIFLFLACVGGGVAVIALRPALQAAGIGSIAAGVVVGGMLGALAVRGGGASPPAPLGGGEATLDHTPPVPSQPVQAGSSPVAAAVPGGDHGGAVPGAAQGAAALYCFDGPDRGRSWPLSYGAVTIGRGPHNTIMLNDPGVSSTHAQIGFDGQHFVLTDLQSRNGCFVNNQRVQRAPLRDRDVIVVGTSYLAVALNAPVVAPVH